MGSTTTPPKLRAFLNTWEKKTHTLIFFFCRGFGAVTFLAILASASRGVLEQHYYFKIQMVAMTSTSPEASAPSFRDPFLGTASSLSSSIWEFWGRHTGWVSGLLALEARLLDGNSLVAVQVTINALAPPVIRDLL